MKTRMIPLIAGAALIAATQAFADDAHHAAADAPSSGAAAVSSAQPGVHSGKRIEAMRSEMLKMMDQMRQLQQTKDPAERQRLLDEHMQTMQETMRTMQGMGGPMAMGMMGAQQKDGAAGHVHGTSHGAGTNERMNMMEQRMDMMQMMMGQMMQQENPPAPKQ